MEFQQGRPRHLHSVDLLVPELFVSEGGIQAYSRTLIRALRTLRPHLKLRVFSRNDGLCHLPEPLPGSCWDGIEWYPASGSKGRFALDILQATVRRRPQLLLSTHAHFAPLQWLHHCGTGVPSWCTAHGIEVWDMGLCLRRWALARLQCLLPVSRFTAGSLHRQLGRRCPPLAILPNSFDVERFSPGPRPAGLLLRYELQTDQPLILTLSRLSRFDRHKNVDALIRALPPLLKRWSDLKLMVAGRGDDLPRLQQLARELGVNRHVIFPGKIPDNELADHFRLATLFALPSEKEGFGIVFLEALGSGLPVLAGNLDGSRDPLVDGRLGLLVDPRLPLAPALANLLERKGQTLWFQPDALSCEAAHRFGFASFCSRLDEQLINFEESQIFC